VLEPNFRTSLGESHAMMWLATQVLLVQTGLTICGSSPIGVHATRASNEDSPSTVAAAAATNCSTARWKTTVGYSLASGVLLCLEQSLNSKDSMTSGLETV